MHTHGLPYWKCYGPYLPGDGTLGCGDHLCRSVHILKSFCTQEIFFDVHGYVV
jgi:hypothetical protein